MPSANAIAAAEKVIALEETRAREAQDRATATLTAAQTTATLQRWTTATRGVGGAIDVATITRTDGFRAIQEKRIVGDRSEL